MDDSNLEFMVDQIDRLLNMYSWTVGIFITIIIFIGGLFIYFQYRFSEKQIENLKNEVVKLVEQEYSLKDIPKLQRDFYKTKFLEYVNRIKSNVRDETYIGAIASFKFGKEYFIKDDKSSISLLLNLSTLLESIVDLENKDIFLNEKIFMGDDYEIWEDKKEFLQEYEDVLKTIDNSLLYEYEIEEKEKAKRTIDRLKYELNKKIS